MAYGLLELAAPVDSYEVGGRVDWGRLVRERDFDFMLSDLWSSARQAWDAGLLKMLVRPLPQVIPDFLKPLPTS